MALSVMVKYLPQFANEHILCLLLAMDPVFYFGPPRRRLEHPAELWPDCVSGGRLAP